MHDKDFNVSVIKSLDDSNMHYIIKLLSKKKIISEILYDR